MSARGRGASLGGTSEDYPTPPWTVWRLLEATVHRSISPRGPWLEPCAGQGGIIQAVEQSPLIKQGAVVWGAVDIQPQMAAPLAQLVGPQNFRTGDFLNMVPKDLPQRPWSTVITNPPYSLAQPFAEQCFRLIPDATVAFLLRINFLASEDRHPWISERVPDVFVLPNRPQFRAQVTPVVDQEGNPVLGRNGKPRVRKTSSDSCEYGWLVWPPYSECPRRTVGSLHVLQTTPKEIRAKYRPAPALEEEAA